MTNYECWNSSSGIYLIRRPPVDATVSCSNVQHRTFNVQYWMKNTPPTLASAFVPSAWQARGHLLSLSGTRKLAGEEQENIQNPTRTTEGRGFSVPKATSNAN